MNHRRSGFTLLEILLVVAAIGVLAAIVFVAINPNRQLAKVRDSERQSEVNTLYDAIQQYEIENNGQWPSEIENMAADSSKEICRAGQTCGSDFVEVENDLVPEYVADVPEGPQAAGNSTGYRVIKSDTGRLAVSTQDNTETKTEPIKAGKVNTGLTYSWYSHPFGVNDPLDKYFNTDLSDVAFEGTGFYVQSVGGWDATRPSYLPEDKFAWKAEGSVYAPKAGDYTFALDSDDQSDVTVNGNVVVTTECCTYRTSDPVTLSKGWHTFRVRMQENGGGEYVKVEWEKPNDSSFSDIPVGNLRP